MPESTNEHVHVGGLWQKVHKLILNLYTEKSVKTWKFIVQQDSINRCVQMDVGKNDLWLVVLLRSY